MFLRRVTSCRAVTYFRPNLLASAGGRAFSSGSRCNEASQQKSDFQTWKPGVSSGRKQLESDIQAVNRKVSHQTKNAADSRRGDTSLTILR
jgi:hypothetical protein